MPTTARRGTSAQPTWDHLPAELRHISQAIHTSRELLALKDEDDLPLFDESTWTRAATFLAEHALWLFQQRKRVIAAPRISPGPNASIDLHWEAENYELLINIRADPSQPAGSYGDDKGRLNIKGTLDLSAYNEGLLSWLEKGSVRLAKRVHTR